MSNLSSADRSTLAKILGRIGSNYDAEALAAARKADAIVRAKGATWPIVLGLDAELLTKPEPEHLAVARDLLGRGKGICTDWEMRFLRGVLAFKTLTHHQRQSLDGIRAKVDAATSNA